jgi:peptidoglycan/LPS O-acetylase OafA/YrhL
VSDTTNTPATPPPLTVAASLVAVEGLVLIAFAVLEIADLDPDRRALGTSTALFFAAYGVLLLVAARSLWRRTAWARGPALITQLILLGIAWNVREHVAAAVGIALVAAVAIAGVAHPDSIEALSGDHD